jgi:hypothetical protein
MVALSACRPRATHIVAFGPIARHNEFTDDAKRIAQLDNHGHHFWSLGFGLPGKAGSDQLAKI